MQWGLIGAGDIVRKRVAEALRESADCTLAGVSRARADLVDPFAREIGAERAYPAWQELVADPRIDAVYIATPVRLHAQQTIAAAEAGKHVLCEKPMAMDVAECDQMIAACRRAGVALGIAYYRRFYPAVIRLKELLDSGEIGMPVFAQMIAFEPFDPRTAWILFRLALDFDAVFALETVEAPVPPLGIAADDCRFNDQRLPFPRRAK